MTPEEEENFPHKNIIVRALGMKDDVLVDTAEFPIKSGDIYVSCSDGLNGEISDEDILNITLEHQDDPEQMSLQLIDAANHNGGKDNVTVALVAIDEA